MRGEQHPPTDTHIHTVINEGHDTQLLLDLNPAKNSKNDELKIVLGEIAAQFDGLVKGDLSTRVCFPVVFSIDKPAKQGVGQQGITLPNQPYPNLANTSLI